MAEADEGPNHDQSGYGVHCRVCRGRVPVEQANVIKTNEGSGRAMRCFPCGDAATARLRAFNARSGRG